MHAPSRAPLLLSLGWWLGLAPATLEFWVQFPNERNQGKLESARRTLCYTHTPPSFTQSPSPPRSLVRDFHTVFGSSSLVAHFLHPTSPHVNSFVICTAVINSNTIRGGTQNLPNSQTGRQGSQPRPGWAPDPPMVGIRSPIGLVVGSCTSHPGVLGSIRKREEPRKTGAPCVKVPGSSRVPVH